MSATEPMLCPLPKVGFLQVEGSDAASFLDAQLSQRLTELATDRSPLAAWHDPRGRVEAVFRVLFPGPHWLLLTHAESVAGLLDRLAVFVLRADVRLADAAASWQGVAVLGAGEEWLRHRGVSLGARPGDASHRKPLIWIRAGDDLLHVVGPPQGIDALTRELPAGPGAEAELAAIRAGLPELAPTLARRFIPQMLNLDLLDALAFDKGCYPGQEVIARIQNLGSVKRRMLRFSTSLATPPDIGSRVLDASGDQAGTVVRVARTAERVELLAVIQLDARDGVLVSERDRDVPLKPEHLPYEV